MRRKLSQSIPCPRKTPAREVAPPVASNPPPDPSAARLGLGASWLHRFLPLAVLFAGLLACSIADPSAEDAAEPKGSSSYRTDRSDPAAGDFRWPSHDDPLLMKIEVATQDGSGTIEVQLLPELAPASVDGIARLAREGHYDGTTFHRVIRGFMIQGGDPNSRDRDPNNDGRGGARIELPDEPSEAPFERGIVALANRGRKGSNTSQFFILQTDHRNLDGQYTAFGRVLRGMDLVDLIANSPTDKVGRWGPKDRPIESISIQRVEISGPGLRAASAEPRATVRDSVLQLSHQQKANPE